jgi:hypothetical protein
MNKELTDLLQKNNAQFDWDGSAWCLFGTMLDNLGWESDDCFANSLEEAEYDATYYLENFEG